MDGSVLDELVRRLAGAQRILVLTGSGVSAESGVPTFRDAQTGLWARYRPEDLATPEAFARQPDLVWSWYEWRRALVRQAQPNAAHRALAILASHRPGLTLITQNVDGLHQRAGSPAVVEFHGNLFTDCCSRPTCGHRETCTEESRKSPPPCPRCSAPLRPGVVWFGEAIPVAALDASQRAVAACDLFLSIGTSSLVYPAAGLAESALDRGVCVIELNPEATPLSAHADLCVRGPAAQTLPPAVERLGRT
jgi:NAD-dependent deacetylase